jgi:hypothetical protein
MCFCPCAPDFQGVSENPRFPSILSCLSDFDDWPDVFFQMGRGRVRTIGFLYFPAAFGGTSRRNLQAICTVEQMQWHRIRISESRRVTTERIFTAVQRGYHKNMTPVSFVVVEVRRNLQFSVSPATGEAWRNWMSSFWSDDNEMRRTWASVLSGTDEARRMWLPFRLKIPTHLFVILLRVSPCRRRTHD